MDLNKKCVHCNNCDLMTAECLLFNDSVKCVDVKEKDCRYVDGSFYVSNGENGGPM